jgi:hypothetical protein
MEQTVERAGEPFEFAEQLTVVGRQFQVGDLVPDLLLERFHPAAGICARSACSTSSLRSERRSGKWRREEWRLLQRAVFVVDRSDRIAYAEYVPDSDERAE